MRRLTIVCLALVALSAVGRVTAQGKESLETAYKREFAFLEAERNTLKQRITDLETEAEKKVAAAEADVSGLQAQVMGTSLEADRLNDLLAQTETQVESASEGDDVLEGLLTQAGSALEKGNIKLPEIKDGDENAKLDQAKFAFTNALTLLDRFGSVRRNEGTFFSADGKQVKGEIVRVGNVASYGVSDQAAGALAPAGQDQLKVWPETPSADTARAVASKSHPDHLKIFLYETLEKDIEAKQERTPLQIVNAAGPIGWVIVGVGGLALLMVLLRAALLARAASNTDKIVERVAPLLRRGDVKGAIEECSRAPSAAGRVMKTTLENIDKPREQLEDLVEESILHEQPVLDRFGSTILVMAAVAPLLGLLGTVTGMISTFDVITEFGTGNPKLLSGGISVALITTELGLIVAIPALVFGNLLTGWADTIKESMDKAALRITNIAHGIHVTTTPPPRGEQETELAEAS